MRAHRNVRPSCVTIGYRPKFSRPSAFPRARKLVTSIVCIAIGAVSVAAAVDVLTRESAQALPASLADPAPLFAPASIADVSRPEARATCSDFAFSFLNPTACAKRHVRHTAALKNHRVATYIFGRGDASP
jgi:hypothetical protein